MVSWKDTKRNWINKKIYKITDIADVNFSGITIDVRTFVNSDALYIPKKHFETGIIPKNMFDGGCTCDGNGVCCYCKRTLPLKMLNPVRGYSDIARRKRASNPYNQNPQRSSRGTNKYMNDDVAGVKSNRDDGVYFGDDGGNEQPTKLRAGNRQRYTGNTYGQDNPSGRGNDNRYYGNDNTGGYTQQRRNYGNSGNTGNYGNYGNSGSSKYKGGKFCGNSYSGNNYY